MLPALPGERPLERTPALVGQEDAECVTPIAREVLGDLPCGADLGSVSVSFLADLITRYQLRGNIVSDAHLAALAIEHGLEVCSNDSDFARFSEVRWTNPVAPA
jgi:predicted nucleic acid-binding protein